MPVINGAVPASAEVIIVGAGSAGCVLARRLVDAGVDVVLIEAGGEDSNPAIHDPTRYFEMEGAAEDWCYASTPQSELGDREIAHPRGKVLGGTSCLNGMIFARGHPSDFDTWAYLGNDGWAYDDVLPLFKRVEDFDAGASPYRGVGGPLRIMSRYEPHPLVGSMLTAAEQAGVERNPDYNGERLEGVAPMQFNIKAGKRHNAWRAFAAPVAAAANLTVVTGARVQRLLLDGDRCSGVEFVRQGAVERIHAELEVVVCAGAFDSPKLLMLSGIGPARELRRVGIDAAVDLPGVGQGLQDHVFSPLVYAATRTVPPPIAGVLPFHGMMFWPSRPGLPGPDLQSLFGPLPYYPAGFGGPGNGFTLTSMLTRPASRGTVRLASADATAPPVIDPAYASCGADVEAIASGFELLREIATQPALADWRGEEVCPGPHLTSGAELRAYVRATLSTIYHPTSTCRMGIDELSVVDPTLRVSGVTNLRIADASVMPLITSANTQAPTMMVAERAAELVLAAHGETSSGELAALHR
jgi:choline dehydrogenase